MGKRFDKERNKEIVFGVLIALGFVLSIFNFVFLPKLPVTGFDISSTAQVIFGIIGDPTILILSPENITYNFTFGGPYILDLNITSNMAISTWTYSLYDLRHSRWVYEDILFSPNTTIDAVRWGNKLFVNGSTSSGRSDDANVTFFVNVPNTAPIIQGVPRDIYVCEASRLNFNFSAMDYDEDVLVGDNSPKYGLFFVFSQGRNMWGNLTNFSIDSGTLFKNSAGGVNAGSQDYPMAISVTDRVLSDTVYTNITVIEINNPPLINPPFGLTTKTIWSQGENSTLFEWINISDVEFDSYGYGNHTFNVSILNSTLQRVNLFNVSNFNGDGLINFTANDSIPVGNYDVRVCVTDAGLLLPHPLISSVCNQTGNNLSTCDNFQLIITDENRPPTITDFGPENLSLAYRGISRIYFNVTKYDPDWTIPDSFWYVDNKLIEVFEGNETDYFDHVFGCGVGGKHKIKVVVSDGELNDSLEWGIDVSYVACTVEGGGGGGGGGGVPGCVSQWVCNPWNVCQNALASLEGGILSGQDYRFIEEECRENALFEERCGFQIRECVDLNGCGPTLTKPDEIQFCLYTANPTCEDGIKNCHDGDCEFLIDCGGPCDVCPSCSDGKKNQGEEGVDCGGPCPWKCEPVVPLLKRNTTIYVFLVILLLVIIFIIYKLVRVLKYKKSIEQSQNNKI